MTKQKKGYLGLTRSTHKGEIQLLCHGLYETRDIKNGFKYSDPKWSKMRVERILLNK